MALGGQRITISEQKGAGAGRPRNTRSPPPPTHSVNLALLFVGYGPADRSAHVSSATTPGPPRQGLARLAQSRLQGPRAPPARLHQAQQTTPRLRATGLVRTECPGQLRWVHARSLLRPL